MASAKRDIRHIIDSFAEDLILIAQDIAREQVERAVTTWQAKNEKLEAKRSAQNEKLQAKKSVQDAKALRNQKALERIERVAERRREREQKKAAERALRLEQRLITSSASNTAGASEKKARGRRSGLLADAAVKTEPAPAPLFVHKRRRDGEIQQLKRTDEELASAAAPAAVTAAPAEQSSSNGASSSVTVPEQLRLGL